MKTQEHTAGPWMVVDDYVREVAPYDEEGHRMGVAKVTKGTSYRPTTMWQANARLIAAAPQLLEALETINELDPAGMMPLDYFSRVKAITEAAIRSAKGETL